MKDQEAARGKRKKIIRIQPGGKPRPSAESLERLRRAAEEKGWIRKGR